MTAGIIPAAVCLNLAVRLTGCCCRRGTHIKQFIQLADAPYQYENQNPFRHKDWLLLHRWPAAFTGTAGIQAASITWSAASTIAGDTDVATAGTLVYAYDESNLGTTVNGVPFAAGNSSSSLGGGNVTISSAGGLAVYNTAFTIGSGTFNGLSFSYKQTLEGAVSDGSSAITTLNNLTLGHIYLVQVWVNAPRYNGTAGTRAETIVGGSRGTASTSGRKRTLSAFGPPRRASEVYILASATTTRRAARGASSCRCITVATPTGRSRAFLTMAA